MKKNLIAFAVLASMVTGLTGCGHTETNKEAPSVNLDYLNINLDEGIAILLKKRKTNISLKNMKSG